MNPIFLSAEEIEEYRKIIGYTVNDGMTFGAFHKRLLELERRRFTAKTNRRLAGHESTKKGYLLEIRGIVKEILAVRNLRDRVLERISD